MKALTTNEINAILKHNPATKNIYLGTYPACITPKSKKKNTLL